MHVSLAPETITTLFGLNITNSLISLVAVALIIFLIFGIYKLKYNYLNPGKYQVMLEMVVEMVYNICISVIGDKRAKLIFPLIFTFIALIVLSNLFGLLPTTPSLVIKENEEVVSTEAPSPESSLSFTDCLSHKNCYLTVNGIEKFPAAKDIFRAPTTDLSFTITLALVSVISTQVVGFAALGFGYIKKFFNFSSPIDFVVGFLELVSEFSKIISFSFRLFGNIFAGELLLTIVTNLSFGIGTLPFLLLEMFVAFIQGYVFIVLTTVFMGLAAAPHQHAEEH
jgi:F-type H+-transporting ATPase subunit a